MDGHEDRAASAGQAGDEAPRDLLLRAAAILEGLPDAVVAAGRDGQIVFVNAIAEELFGYPREELLGLPVEMLWPERIRVRYSRNMRLYFETGHPLSFSSEAWGLRRDGSEFPGEMSWGIVETTAGPLLLAVGRDISERQAAEKRLQAVAAIGERALAGADPAELATEAVEVMRRTLPIAGAEVRLADGISLASAGITATPDLQLPVGDAAELLVGLKRGLGEEEMSFVRTLSNTLAMALARRRDEERIRYEALHDPLTGLANRTLLRDRLEHALAHAGRGDRATGVLFVDLDDFKQVNDIYGHATGDSVLVALGSRLRSAVRPVDTVARLGGDEFVVICEQVDETVALALAQRVQDAVGTPVSIDGVEHRLSASVGIALGHDDADALLSDADAAVYRAKAAPGGSVEVSRG
ncbi:MAG: diguanylate cyclase domain-containing protein [Solirubrobacteraceae bacterium]